MLLPILATLLTSPAQAGELLVSAPITMVVSIDGMAQDFDVASSKVVARDLAGGSYQVEVHNAFGKLKAQLLVEVAADEAVALTYEKRQLIETGRGPVRPEGTPTVEDRTQGIFDAIERTAEEVSEEIQQGLEPINEAAQDAADAVDQGTREAIEEVEGVVDPD